MPLKSILQTPRQVWEVIFDGTIVVADIEAALQATFAVVDGCRSLWDFAPAKTMGLNRVDVQIAGQRIAAATRTTAGGALAFVAPSDQRFGVARELEAYAECDGSALQLGVFRDRASAELWLGPPPQSS